MSREEDCRNGSWFPPGSIFLIPSYLLTIGAMIAMLNRNIGVLIFGLLLGTSGCFAESGVPLGIVQGVVTKDGVPVPSATVTFYPEQGRPSIGITDDEGHYQLKFTESRPGAVVGTHRVNISHGGSPPPGDPGSPGERSMRKRPLPLQEVQWSEPVTVERSSNTINFDL